MTTYFKATRPDGYDFATGTVLYEVGKTVRPKSRRGLTLTTATGIRYLSIPRMCGPGYLHAADVPTETLVMGSWPCRLFTVEGKPKAGFDEQHPHKGGFRQLRVTGELPAWQVFGPQGERVVALIDRASRLTMDEVGALHAAWAARDARDATAAAWAARAAPWAAWAAAWNAARTATWTSRAIAWNAALALVIKDLISTEQFALLYGPWAKVIGE
jgi:hypothetical protein